MVACGWSNLIKVYLQQPHVKALCMLFKPFSSGVTEIKRFIYDTIIASGTSWSNLFKVYLQQLLLEGVLFVTASSIYEDKNTIFMKDNVV